jgi:glycosyltransferase involved in cell wall biosynthesis
VTELSVVIPVYGCEGALRELHARVCRACEEVTDDFELVLIEDRGSDSSWELLAELARADDRVRAFRLSRNFGQHFAITAGLAECRGRRAIVMDCDLQDPPEEIPRLYAKASEGWDIVFGRRKLKRTSWRRRAVGSVYFTLLNWFTGAGIDGQQGSLSVISRKVIDAFLRFEDRDRHYLLILRWLGFESTVIDYEQAERAHGHSSYTTRDLIGHALGGIFFQTTKLLRWIVGLGFMVSLAGMACAAYLVYAKIAHHAAPGWTSLAVFTLTIGGFIIVSTGVTGLYIGKVFEQVKGRPLYVIDRAIENGQEVASEEGITEFAPHRPK